MQSENKPLTALRGFAAVWVFGHHYYGVLTAAALLPAGAGLAARLLGPGYMAVDIFFVLSGFILAAVYRELAAAAVPSYLLRRVCRVYPLHLSVMLGLGLLVFAATLRHRALHANETWAAFPYALLLVQPYFLPAPTWNAPSWSIGVELLCYLLFPLSVPLLRRAPRVAAGALAVLLGAAEYWVLTRYAGVTNGEGAVLRGLCGFGWGVVLFRLVAGLRPPAAAVGLGEAAALAGIAAGFVLDAPWLIPLAAALLIVCLYAGGGPVGGMLHSGWCVWLGRVSFSIYLLHAPLIAGLFLRGRVPTLGLPPGWALPLQGVLVLALVLALSELTYRFIEAPGRRLPRLLLRRRPAPLPADLAPALDG